MSDVYSLADRIAVVTGVSSGIGQAIAVGLARQGAHVAGDFLRNADGAAETARLIEAEGREALILQGDTGDETHIEALADAAVSRWGRLDVWVNNAARLMVKPVLETTSEDWHALLAANLHGYFYGCRAAAGADARPGAGPHHQHHLAGVHAGHRRPLRLHRRQGRHPGPHPGHGHGAGRAWASPSTRSLPGPRTRRST